MTTIDESENTARAAPDEATAPVYQPPAMLRISGADETEVGLGIAIVVVAAWGIGIGIGWGWGWSN
jgi:hypothetical protein